MSRDVKRIEVTRYGGLTGMVRSASVDLSTLSAEDAKALESLVAAALPELRAAQVAQSRTEPGADRFEYDVRIEAQDNLYELRVGEADVPPALKPLIARVMELGRRRPP
jgi:hypothetical protein